MIARQAVIAIATLAMAFGSVDAVSAQTARAYQAADLGTLGGHDLVGLAVNGRGEVVGYGLIADGTPHAFRWSPWDGLHDIAPGGHDSQAFGINDHGDIVGVWFDQAENQSHAFVLPRGGVARDIAPNVLRVNAILNDGRMTGFAFAADGSSQIHAFRLNQNNSVQDVDAGSEFASDGWDLNELGQVTGYAAHDSQGAQSAFRFSDGAGKEDLGTLGGGRSAGLSINNFGVVVGWSEVADPQIWSRAFRARPGFPIEDLGALSGQLAGADAINDAGAIVGWSDSASGFAPFVYTDAGGMIDLRSRVARTTTGSLSEAVAINNAGQIVVLFNGGDRTGTYRLTPVVDVVGPTASAAASPASLWPPNDRMIPVTVEMTTADDFDPAPACGIVSVKNSDPPSHGIDRDVQITGAHTLSLRASSQGGGDTPRTYTIRVRCTDFSGNATETRAVVAVRRDRR